MPTKQRAAKRPATAPDLPAVPPVSPVAPLPTWPGSAPIVSGAQGCARYILRVLHGGSRLELLFTRGKFYRWNSEDMRWDVMPLAELRATAYQVFTTVGRRLDGFAGTCGVSRFVPLHITPSLIERTMFHLRNLATYPAMQVLAPKKDATA